VNAETPEQYGQRRANETRSKYMTIRIDTGDPEFRGMAWTMPDCRHNRGIVRGITKPYAPLIVVYRPKVV